MRVLIIDDVTDMAETVGRYLKAFGFDVALASSGTEGIAKFQVDPTDAVVTDLNMKDCDGLEVLDAIKRRQSQVPVIVMTAFGAIDSAIEAMRRGAYHYITKPFDMEMLRLLLERARGETALRSENARLRRSLREQLSSDRLLGQCVAMRELRALIDRVAGATSPVLIVGETGTGKDLVASAIHADGPRGSAPFVAVNCAALPEPLLESELFGHAKGAFTGASQARKGLFAEADGGTLFLDEIGDMPLALQAKLLRVLQSGEVRPVGSEAVRTVDVRCIAATHKNLRVLIEEGRFREDLYFRLDVLRVRVPPLRDRSGDVPMLLNHFLARCRERMHEIALAGLTPEALEFLATYSWPGNVRELQNLVERLAVSTSVSHAGLAEVRSALGEWEERNPVASLLRNPMELGELEDRYIAAVLEKFGGSKPRAAAVLGIDLSTLYRRTQKKAGE